MTTEIAQLTQALTLGLQGNTTTIVQAVQHLPLPVVNLHNPPPPIPSFNVNLPEYDERQILEIGSAVSKLVLMVNISPSMINLCGLKLASVVYCTPVCGKSRPHMD